METVVQVKRKGCNDSYRYMEYYLHNALQAYGYSLTRDEATADFSVTAYLDWNETYFSLISPFFDRLQGDTLDAFLKDLAAAMKSEVWLHPYPQPEDDTLPNVSVFCFLYSRTSNAYQEPALIESGDSNLDFEGHYWTKDQRGNVGFTLVNYGGPSKGLTVSLQAPLWAAPFLTVESAQIRRYTKQGGESREMVFQRNGARLVCSMEQFDILPGRNRMSALWCRTRTKYQCAVFYIDLIIKNRSPLHTQLLLEVDPFSGEGCTATIEL
ncbi:MAG: hypothetical protein E7655_05440 [Ruminococcaceae bacterium]|nr:hypothetical protein [Oscillospiraceae bacterium]